MSLSKAISHQICGVSFGIYSSDDIKRLSVLEVVNDQSFDALGHVTIGGLCDNALGPAKRNEFCSTCGMNDLECPGHFGHITLPLPVFNPVLIRQMFQILQMCCFKCDHLLFTAVALETTIAQMEALDLGYDYLVGDLEEMVTSLVMNSVSIDVDTMRDYVRIKLAEKIEEENKRNINSSKSDVNVKNVVERRQKIFRSFMQGKLLKVTRTCIRCNSKKQGMSVVNNALIIMNAGKTSEAKKASGKRQSKASTVEMSMNPSDADMTIEMSGKSYLTPIAAKTHLRAVWNNEKVTMGRLFKFLNPTVDTKESSPVDIFFLDVIAVSPNRFRPMHYMNGRQYENEHTAALSQVMIAARVLSECFKVAKQGSRQSTSNATEGMDKDKTDGSKAKDVAKFHLQWQKLQLICNRIYDSDLDKMPDNKFPGVKQNLEKKEGLFRKHMMGKRVNFAARSVISPDPYIMADEIGIPLVFATKLTYPQPVTRWNLTQLQQMVMNGPNIHPGAISVQSEDGMTIRLKADDSAQRKSIADRLGGVGFRSGPLSGVKIVNRHLITGDVLLLNRQPTLHKPSIMGHKARVLPSEKTLRLHYANCKCYNADFDGDEMNAHFPQSELARSEAYHIASVNYNLLVPKDGTPLSGLIQDHIIAGVMLTIRGSFFTKGDYQELLYGALSFLTDPIKLLPPTIIKPKQLWSGKQIVSTILLNIVPNGRQLPTLNIASKLNPKILQTCKPRKWIAGGTPLQMEEMCESQVIFSKGELVCGIIDKVSLGPTPFGLIHSCYELYGGSVSTGLLTAFARICTNYLQIHHGFSLGIHDILVNDKANSKRRKYIERSYHVGDKAAGEALGVEDYANEEQLLDSLQNAHINKSDTFMKALDKSVKSQTDEVNNNINEVCIKGLIKRFPENNMQLMIQAGAKGASVNAIQISCLLGQIELEGRRIPLMMSGRTLPSFKAYDTTPRAGGFVAGRFMTGIRPQEFFFHCMAGREGLIDTAVKTSRSGYLQRCLIKHLEGIKVNYDLTVRDSDGSVVQMLYGEDGIDILKSQLIKDKMLPMIVQNNETLKPSSSEIDKLAISTDHKNIQKHQKKIQKWLEKNKTINRLDNPCLSPFLRFSIKEQKTNHLEDCSKQELENKWYNLDDDSKIKFRKYSKACPIPINNAFQSDVHIGAVSEKLESLIDNYMSKNPHKLLAESKCDMKNKISHAEFKRTMNAFYMRSLCHPGEAVGLLASQSIGEPSTQMTLNTFHFAGRGEMNVTLGIPRLREILMTASANISTPSMDIPFLTNYDGDMDKIAEKVRKSLSAVKLSDVIEYVDVKESLEIEEDSRRRVYDLTFHFLPHKCYKHQLNTNPSRILHHMENRFIKKLIDGIKKKFKSLARSHGLFDHSVKMRTTSSKPSGEGDDDEQMANENGENIMTSHNEEEMSSEDEAADGDGDTTNARHKNRHNQDQEYEEPEDNEVQIIPDSDIEEIIENLNDNDETKSQPETPNNEAEDGEQVSESNNLLDITLLHRKLKRQARKDELESQKVLRKNKVESASPFVTFYDFDTDKEEWCHFVLKYDLLDTKLDISSLVEDEARKSYVHKVGDIDRAFLVKDSDAAKRGVCFDKILKTEGVSLLEVVKFDHIVDINRIYSNDIHAIARTYGIEAAAKAIQKEIANVFAVYGIKVDGRHLSLVSDYMTYSGTIKGMNRMSMEGVSPIQAMTFETTTTFLKSATLNDLKDDLSSPSARIVVGRPSLVGTGVVEVLSNPLAFQNVIAQSQSFAQSVGSVIDRDKWKIGKQVWQGKRKSIRDSLIMNKRIKFD